MPLDEAHPAPVTLKLLPRRRQVLHQTMMGDFPHFYLPAEEKHIYSFKANLSQTVG